MGLFESGSRLYHHISLMITPIKAGFLDVYVFKRKKKTQKITYGILNG